MKTKKTFSLQFSAVREAGPVKCQSPSDVRKILETQADLPQEAFTVITLNTKNSVIDTYLIALGMIDTCQVSPCLVFRPAVESAARHIIVAHNHPSGDPTPSADDIRITRQLIEAGKILDILVMDHVIIGRGQTPFFSIRESGLAEF